MGEDEVTSMEPPAAHPEMIVTRIWPVPGGWRYDVQFPGPPRGRASGEWPTAADALEAAAAAMRHFATTPMAQIRRE